jgi:hypothetical protein
LIFLLAAQYRFEIKERKGSPALMIGGRLVASELVLNDKDGRERVRLSAGNGYGQLQIYGGSAPHDESILLTSAGIHIYQGEWPVAELGGSGVPQPVLQLFGNGKVRHRSIWVSVLDDPLVSDLRSASV